MGISQSEFHSMMDDEAKWIPGDIDWREDSDHAPAFEFMVEVQSEAGYPLLAKGRANPVAGTLSFVLIHRQSGRVYALDLGADHHNPSCTRTGELHKHSWTEQHADKEAYVPKDITAGADDPVGVWLQFCAEAKIRHDGVLHRPPALQEDLLP